MKQEKLSDKAEELYKFVVKYKKANKRFPPIGLMSEKIDRTKKRVYQLLEDLIADGRISRDRDQRYNGFDVVEK